MDPGWLGLYAALRWLAGVGARVSYFRTIGTPVALTAIAFALGLLLLPLGEETKAKPLPA